MLNHRHLWPSLFLALGLLGKPQEAPAAEPNKSPITVDVAAEQAWLRHGFDDAGRERIRAAFREGIERKVIPGGGLLILYRGEPIFREAFGAADLETGRPFTIDAPCRIASVTKPHTATLMALLVEQGKLSWDDPIDKHLPYFAGVEVRGKGKAMRAPKVRELLSHTAGFPGQPAIDSGQWQIKTDGSLADAVEDLPRQALAAEPGSVFAYTGLGYMVAGRIAELVSGKDFATLMEEQLLKPIGATTATFNYSEQLKARMPTPYERKNGEFVRVDLASRLEASAKFPNPAGRLISTLEDVGRFLLLHRNHGMVGNSRLVASDVLRELYKPQPATGRNGYGLGFNALKVNAEGYAARIRHIGASGTLAELDFDHDIGIVLLTQVPQAQTVPFRDRLLREIYTVLASRDSDQPAGADSSARLNRIDPPTPQALQDIFQRTPEALPLVSAHRGGAQAGFPENCLATFENTLRHTFAMLEVDPRYTKDGEMVLHHDATLERTTTGRGRVAEFTLAELKQLRLKDPLGKATEFQIPTLDEALQWARGKAVLVLDQKDVPAADRIKKVERHKAEGYAMLIVYNFKDVQASYALNPNIMMEVMVPNREKAAEFDKLNVPWRNVVAFVGHNPPEDLGLYELIHARGACCLIGTSRNLDRRYLSKEVQDLGLLEPDYRAFLKRGADLIETDIPAQLGPLLYGVDSRSRVQTGLVP